ncbi:MAG: sugar phosphate isomerase/epimerase family protein, partial [Bryobacteraceae bacterium]
MTNKLTRRRFLSSGAAASIAALPASDLAAGVAKPAGIPQRRFYTNLSLGRLGFHANFNESVELAVKYGFEGVDPDPNYFASLDEGGFRRLLDDIRAKNLKFGSAGLPVEFRKDETTFNAGLKKLPATADILRRAGIGRVNTWVLPCSNELTYLQNFRQHADRLHQCAKILGDYGQKLGLE